MLSILRFYIKNKKKFLGYETVLNVEEALTILNKELNPAFHASRPGFELVFSGAHCRAGKRAGGPSFCVGIFDSQSVKTVSK